MVNIHVLNQNFELVDVVDDYISVIWRPSYCDIGDFEIYATTTAKLLNTLKEEYYLVRDTDVSVDESGNVTYKNVMIIHDIQLTTSVEDGDRMIVTGKELKYLLHRRIVNRQMNFSGNVETELHRMVSIHAINCENPIRKIPNFVLGKKSGLPDTFEKQVSYKHLDEVLVEVCTAYNYGWEVYIHNNNYVFQLYCGTDRSYEQNAVPYVVFSESFDNIDNTQYQLKTEGYANCAYVGGEGEGSSRIIVVTGATDAEGLDRFETFVDARDSSSNGDSESFVNYVNQLRQRGNEDLVAMSYTEGFSGDILYDANFVYGKDFFMGDMVTVISKYGVTKNVRVLSVIESEDSDGRKIVPQFNI